MKFSQLTSLVCAGALLLTVSPGLGLTRVPKDYPAGNSNATVSGQQNLSSLVAIYQNDIALLATDPEQHEVSQEKVEVDQSIVSEISRLAGQPPTLASISEAVREILQNNPERAVPVTAAALSLLSSLNVPPEAQVAVIATAIQTVNGRAPRHAEDIAILIGFAVQIVDREQRNDVLRQLRNLAISQMPDSERPEYAFALDNALEQYSVVFQQGASEELLASIREFLPEAEMDAFTEFGDFLLVDYSSMNFYSGDAMLVSPFGTGGLFIGTNPGNLNEFPSPPEEPTPTPAPTAQPTPPPAS